MREKLSSPTIEMHEYADSVSGTDVITARHSRSRFAAAAAEDGYMQFSSGRIYKLKNESDLEAYNDVLKKHLIKNN